MTYKAVSGAKPGCVLKLGSKELSFTRNSKTYYFSSGGKKKKMSAGYMQCAVSSVDMIYYDTLRSIVGCSYYNTEKTAVYYDHGYSGVIVYSKLLQNPKLPDSKDIFGEAVTADITHIDPIILQDKTIYPNGITQVSATYSIQSKTGSLMLDLSDVLNKFKSMDLPSDGVYGYGSCNGVITIQGIDEKGHPTGKATSDGKEFLVDFPDAVRLSITGDIKNLIVSFTPVKPILITETTTYLPKDIDWLSPDGCSMQFFVLPPYTNFNFYNWITQVALRPDYQVLDAGNQEPNDFNSAFQVLSVIFDIEPEQFINGEGFGIQFKIMKKVIDNSVVAVYDSEKNSEAVNYEEELIRMIKALKKAGSDTFFPDKNWENKLTIKVKDGIETGSTAEVSVMPEDTDLAEPFDYYVHLHEMTHFYDQQQYYYGANVRSWVEGNALALAEQVMISLGINYKDIYNYQVDLSFLTEKDKKDFEKYYFNTADGFHEYVAGYHFNKFLRATYGEDVIIRIINKSRDIKCDQGRSSELDAQFAKCMKDATSKDVFQKFINEYVNKK